MFTTLCMLIKAFLHFERPEADGQAGQHSLPSAPGAQLRHINTVRVPPPVIRGCGYIEG